MIQRAGDGNILQWGGDTIDLQPKIRIENPSAQLELRLLQQLRRQQSQSFDENILPFARLDAGEKNETQPSPACRLTRTHAEIWNGVVERLHRPIGKRPVNSRGSFGGREDEFRERKGAAQFRILAQIVFADRARFVDPPEHRHRFFLQRGRDRFAPDAVRDDAVEVARELSKRRVAVRHQRVNHDRRPEFD